nr:hypothetical protein [Lysinibacillus sp. SDF0037]
MSGFDIEMLGLQELQQEVQRRLNPENIVDPALQKGAEHLRELIKMKMELYRLGLVTNQQTPSTSTSTNGAHQRCVLVHGCVLHSNVK